MGLAGPKNRFKLSKDPNNTNWSRNTSRFGHKILTAQGWTPGTHLGAANASHAAHHTAASFSHIRVLLKDDNLGLGAKRGSERAENFGMANFDDLLARLNGKSVEKLAEDKGKRRDAEMKVFHSQRWGRMVFVSGGFLVGDDIVKGKREQILSQDAVAEKEVIATESGNDSKEQNVKRKRSEESGLETIDEEDEERRLRKKKRKSNLRAELVSESDKPSSKKDKKEKKEKDKKSKDEFESSKKAKKSKSASTSSDSEDAPSKSITKSSKATKESEKAAHKAAKKARKEEKRARKEARRAKKASKASKTSTSTSSPSSSASPPPDTAPKVAAAAPPASTLASITNSARHNARRRYIQAKRSAIMDPQALREIFMIKGQG